MSFRQHVFTATLGLWLGLVLIKLGNPVVLDYLVNDPKAMQRAIPSISLSPSVDSELSPPQTSWMDDLITPWPLAFGLWSFLVVAALGIVSGPFKCRLPWWILVLLGGWFIWQLIAAMDSIDAQLTSLTIKHFLVCIGCFLLGGIVLSQCPNTRSTWIGITSAMLIIFWVGFQQHYGGLESLKKAVFESPNLPNLPSELIKRVSSGRIFSTFVYPNALAGVILLLLPPCLAFLYRSSREWPHVVSGVVIGLFAYAGLACLIWSKSKAGWLVALVMGLVAFWRLPTDRKLKWILVGCLLTVGIIGFGLRYYQYFERGATSVSARFDYWNAALKITLANPITGTGPGSFFRSYAKVKSPDSEMARLTHNDYLEQACDSGLPGFCLYSGFIIGCMLLINKSKGEKTSEVWPVGIGLLGWAMHALVEFSLYIPAIAWPAFTLLGWSLAKSGGDRLAAATDKQVRRINA